ncbi:hypothetical protein UPYG_G00019160 [Umbra pygmaea]|uniref:RING-type E3 ubiquitin transferase n=1 Tax=Umbra pygmaea TaxID=75934 RepID=A0ABD0XKE0_UMBPY
MTYFLWVFDLHKSHDLLKLAISTQSPSLISKDESAWKQSQSVMDSKPRRLPFTGGRNASSYSSPTTYTPSSVGSSGLYGRSSVLNTDRFTRATSLKPDLSSQGSRYLSSNRDYSNADSRLPSLKSPLTTSSVSYDRSWAQSSLSSRSKLTDSERRLGTYSGLVSSTTDDGDTKRAKLSYTNRATYARSPSGTASSYSSTVLNRDQDSPSWKSYRPLSGSSSSSSSSSSELLWSRRDLEKKSLSSLPDATSQRSSGLTSSLHRPDRVTSTYAQGARPKETLYSSSSRDSSSLSRHLTSVYQPSTYTRDSLTSRSSSRSLTTHSSLCMPQKPVDDPDPAPAASSSASRTSRYTAPLVTREPRDPSPPPRPTPEGGEVPDGRCSTRRLLSRLFSRRSSQDSSSSSASSSHSFDSVEEASAVEGEVPGPAANVEDGARPPSAEPAPRASDAAQAFAFLRRRRQGLSPVQEGQRALAAQPALETWREGGVTGGSSWFSSIRNHSTPLFSRRRREGRDESARLATTSNDGYQGAQLPPSNGVSPEAEEFVGAVAASGVTRAGPALQDLQGVAGRSQRLARVMDSPLFRVPENVMIAMDMSGAARSQPEGQEKPAPSRDPEKLRKIQESLLLEDSDEEGDLCRICQMGEESPDNPLIEPCRCTGSLQYVHRDCIKKWLRSKISSGTNLEAITTCELCKQKLHLNIENFDINELYRTHERSEYEFISCGLYLVVLLHLCEQRFSDVLGAANDAGFFNLARTLHEHMDNLESSYGESDEEVVDTRPSIDFCDLDEDLEEE